MDTKRSRRRLAVGLLAAAALLAGCKQTPGAPAPEQPETLERLELAGGPQTVAANETFELILDADTAHVQVVNRHTGAVYQAAPALANGEETVGLAKSMVDIVYYNGYSKIGTMNSYDDAVTEGQVAYYRREDGVRIEYTMGEVQKEYLVPPVIEKNRFEEKILNRVDADSQAMLLVYYRLIDLDGEDVTEEEREETLKQYPQAAEQDLYVLAAEFADYVMEELEGYIRPSGYSAADLEEDKKAFNIASAAAQTQFVVPVDLVLQEDGLSVSVDMQQVRTALEEDVLTEVHLFRNFDAAGAEESGYFLVPDGSGALIRFNNGKGAFPSYSQTVYGRDKTLNWYTKEENEQTACLPVYGTVRDSRASLAVIEEGAGLASIHAGVRNDSNPNNFAYSSFQVRPFEVEEISIGGNEGINSYAPQTYDGRLTVHFLLLGENSDYVTLAEAYRGYLLERGGLRQLEAGEDLPFLLRLDGAVTEQSSVLGIPVDKQVALTTFEQARTIADALAAEGIHKIQLRYDACFNGGRLHAALNRANLVGSLGGRNELAALRETLRAADGELFLDMDIQYVFGDGWFDGFDDYRDAAKTLDKEVAVDRRFNYGTLLTTKYQTGYILSPALYDDYLDGFLSDYAELGMTGLSVGSLGSDVNADFSKANPVHRERALALNEQALRRIREQDLTIFSGGANAYVLAHASCLSGFPLQSSRQYIEDEEVPFYPIVAHGYIPYAGEAFNLAGDIEQLTLRSIEYGAVPYFDWVAADNMTLKRLGLQTYAVQYAAWLPAAAQAYRQINDALGDVQAQCIVGHEQVADGVFCTTYESGRRVLVNYSEQDCQVGDVTVPARGYAKGGPV